MNDETSKTTPGAQEAQEMTPATMVINAAATISGKDADALTFADAIKLLIDDQTGGGDKLADVLAVITIRSADDMELNERICAAKTAEECAEILAPVINELLAQEVQIDITGRSFDPDFFRAAIDAAGGLAAIGRRAKELLTAPIKEWLKAVMQTEIKQLQELGKAAKIMYATTPPIPEESIAKIADAIRAAIDSEGFKALKANLQFIDEYIAEHKEEFEAAERLKKLKPFIEMELDEAEPGSPFHGWTVKKFFAHAVTAAGEPKSPDALDLIERAKKRQEAHESAKKVVEDYEKIVPILPGHHIMPNNAAINALHAKDAIGAGAFDEPVIKADKSHAETTVYIMAEFKPDDNGTVITSKRLTEDERQIADALISLWIEAKKTGADPVFSIDMIYRAMPGNGDRPSKKRREEIETAIEKLRYLHVHIDATDELRRRGIIAEDASFVFDDFYITAQKGKYTIKNGGQQIVAYKMKGEPIMYQYSEMTGQLLSVQRKHIEIQKTKDGELTGKRIAMTSQRQAMTGYMLRRIRTIQRDHKDAAEKLRKHTNRREQDIAQGKPPREAKTLEDFTKLSPVILFDTIFAETGAETSDRAQEKANRDFCFMVLDFWKATGLIAGYEVRKKKKSFDAIVIKFDDEEKPTAKN